MVHNILIFTVRGCQALAQLLHLGTTMCQLLNPHIHSYPNMSAGCFQMHHAHVTQTLSKESVHNKVAITETNHLIANFQL